MVLLCPSAFEQKTCLKLSFGIVNVPTAMLLEFLTCIKIPLKVEAVAVVIKLTEQKKQDKTNSIWPGPNLKKANLQIRKTRRK